MNRNLKYILIFITAYGCFSGIFFIFTPQYARIYMPYIDLVLSAMYPDYYQLSPVTLMDNGQIFNVNVRLEGETFVNGHRKKGEITSNGYFQTSFITIYPSIIFSLFICWPGVSLKIRIIAIIIAVQLMGYISLCDATMSLMHSTERKFSSGLPAQGLRNFIAYFFTNGGRQFCAIIITWSSLSLSRWGFE